MSGLGLLIHGVRRLLIDLLKVGVYIRKGAGGKEARNEVKVKVDVVARERRREVGGKLCYEHGQLADLALVETHHAVWVHEHCWLHARVANLFGLLGLEFELAL